MAKQRSAERRAFTMKAGQRLREAWEARGQKPTQPELARAAGITQPEVSTFFATGRRHRGLATPKIKILAQQLQVDLSDLLGEGELREVPFVGYITAGAPVLAEEHILRWYQLPGRKLPPPGQVYLVRVSGTSMVHEHIADGDLVVVRLSKTASPGQIVVALIDGKTTLRRYETRTEAVEVAGRREEQRTHWLVPNGADPAAKPVRVPEDEESPIRGVVLLVLRELEKVL